jgi:hypothetical protein
MLHALETALKDFFQLREMEVTIEPLSIHQVTIQQLSILLQVATA